jgi:hypothetical protein
MLTAKRQDCRQIMLQLALDVIAGFTSGEDDEKMTSTLFQFVAMA